LPCADAGCRFGIVREVKGGAARGWRIKRKYMKVADQHPPPHTKTECRATHGGPARGRVRAFAWNRRVNVLVAIEKKEL